MSRSSLVPTSEPKNSETNWLQVHFGLLLSMDLLARTGYQMGKSPLLPLFSTALGAGTEMTGLVVAISTTTGLFTSPLLGTLSDYFGRRKLLLIGTAMFAFVPFVYLFIQTPSQLLLVRLIHGFATAIYGPVVAALVAEVFQERQAEHMGWYRSVRTASYLLGPLLGGFVLFYADFRTAWIAVGVLGLIAFLPAMLLPWGRTPESDVKKTANTLKFIRRHVFQAFRNPELLSLGIVEAALYLGLRAQKAFLPLYAVSVGINLAQIGVILSFQVVITLLAQPICGKLADRAGRKTLILGGLMLVALGRLFIFMVDAFSIFMLMSAIFGLGEAAIMPSVATLGGERSDYRNHGSTFGMLDAMDNVGKASGPIIAGLLLGVFNYETSFSIIAGILLAVALIFHLKLSESFHV